MSYLFYDLETSGLNKSFDQILQFSAIRTDEALQEQERHNIYVQLNLDTIPAAEALLVHRISLSTLSAGIPEYDAIAKIHTVLNHPNTCSLGYNTLGFDDEFLRFSFYRNLRPPYTHQYANGCSRADLYPLVVLYYLYHPDCLEWPIVDTKISLRLEALNEANAWVSGRAHDAMVDVEVTIALAKKLQAVPALWNYSLGYFNKETERQRLCQLPVGLVSPKGEHHLGLYIDGSLGNRNNFQCMVLSLGWHAHYRNQSLWLRLDDPELREIDINHIPKSTRIIRKRLAEPGFILPPKERFQRLTADRLEEAKKNLAWLIAHEEVLLAITDYYCQACYPVIPDLDPQAALYQEGFFLPEDEKISRQFHQTDQAQRSRFIELFQSERVRMLAIRIIGRLSPEKLTDEQSQSFKGYLQAIYGDDRLLIDYRGATHRSAKSVIETILALRMDPTLDQEQQVLLEEFYQYLQNKISQIALPLLP